VLQKVYPELQFAMWSPVIIEDDNGEENDNDDGNAALADK